MYRLSLCRIMPANMKWNAKALTSEARSVLVATRRGHRRRHAAAATYGRMGRSLEASAGSDSDLARFRQSESTNRRSILVLSPYVRVSCRLPTFLKTSKQLFQVISIITLAVGSGQLKLRKLKEVTIYQESARKTQSTRALAEKPSTSAD